MSATCTFIGDQRRAAQKRLGFLVSMALASAVIACLLFAVRSNLDEAIRQEKEVADLACRSAGAAYAVRVGDERTAVFMCNAPQRGPL